MQVAMKTVAPLLQVVWQSAVGCTLRCCHYCRQKRAAAPGLQGTGSLCVDTDLHDYTPPCCIPTTTTTGTSFSLANNRFLDHALQAGWAYAVAFLRLGRRPGAVVSPCYSSTRLGSVFVVVVRMITRRVGFILITWAVHNAWSVHTGRVVRCYAAISLTIGEDMYTRSPLCTAATSAFTHSNQSSTSSSSFVVHKLLLHIHIASE